MEHFWLGAFLGPWGFMGRSGGHGWVHLFEDLRIQELSAPGVASRSLLLPKIVLANPVKKAQIIQNVFRSAPQSQNISKPL